VLCEMYLFTAFLPMQWQRNINDSLPDILPKSHDLTPITHPCLLREHVGLRIMLFAVTVALPTYTFKPTRTYGPLLQ
jgi:hypothetical protein